MAVTRRYECDLDGTELHPDAVLVIRAGTVANRPDECERFDIGPCCYGSGPLNVIHNMMAGRRAEAGQDKHGNPVPEVADEQEQGQAAARV